MFKLKVNENGDKIKELLVSAIGQLKEVLGQLDPMIGSLLNCLETECILENGFVFLIVELNHLFFNDLATSIHELALVISPNCQLQMYLEVVSSLFSQFLSSGSQNVFNESDFSIGINADNGTMKKIKKIINEKATDLNTHHFDKIMPLLMSTLFEEIQMELSFKKP